MIGFSIVNYVWTLYVSSYSLSFLILCTDFFCHSRYSSNVCQIYSNIHFPKVPLNFKNYIDRFHILLNWLPNLSKQASKQTNKTCFECITSHIRIVGRDKILSGHFQEKIIYGNEEYPLSGANLITQKKSQVGDKCLSQILNSRLWGICQQSIDILLMGWSHLGRIPGTLLA